ncbi:MAG: two component transcriptional regulator, LuxR family [Verrucomicrobia bacterium]|nr:two component transcriptional regulator, LuxR family [Verrucomicrobiota bacterium]
MDSPPLRPLSDSPFAPPSPRAHDPVRRVVIAKPMKLYAEALGVVCQQVFTEATVEVYGRGGEALSALRAEPADLLVMGLAFPDVDGLDLLEPIAHERLARRVLVDSPRRDEYSLLVLRTARFDGFIDASSEGLEAMSRALRAVAEGRGYISAGLRPELLDRPPETALSRRLTAAEIHVLSVIGDGSDNEEGAGRLGLSASTVQTHRRNIMRKLGISTSAKLVREAVRLGVVRIGHHGVIPRVHGGAAFGAGLEPLPAPAAEKPLVPASCT